MASDKHTSSLNGSRTTYEDKNLTLKGQVLSTGYTWLSLANATKVSVSRYKADSSLIVRGVIDLIIGIAAGIVGIEEGDYLLWIGLLAAALFIGLGIHKFVKADSVRAGVLIHMNDGSSYLFTSKNENYIREVAAVLGEALQTDAHYNLTFDMSTSNTTFNTGSTTSNVNYGTNYGNVGAAGTTTYGGTAYSAQGTAYSGQTTTAGASYSAPGSSYYSYPYGTYGQQYFNGQTSGR